MTLALQQTAPSPSRPSAVSTTRLPSAETCRIEIVENTIYQQDPILAAELEGHVRRVLRDQSLGPVAVRFRACRNEEDDALQFICKVENPPQVDTGAPVPWRWWSPILGNGDQFAAALEDGLRVRRARLMVAPPRG
jgi:hypothetical protein